MPLSAARGGKLSQPGNRGQFIDRSKIVLKLSVCVNGGEVELRAHPRFSCHNAKGDALKGSSMVPACARPIERPVPFDCFARS